MQSLFALLSLSSIFDTALGYANPGPCSGVCGNSHDPAIVRRSDGTYFRFSTNNRIPIHTAPSISGPWTFKGAALPGGSQIPMKGNHDLWAPDVTKIGDKYYLLYTVSTFGSQNSAIGYATSPSMEVGSWTDHGHTGVNSTSDRPYNAIDGNLVVGEGGKLYMAFGSFWRGLYITSMQGPSPMLSKAGGERQMAYKPSGGHEVEASYIYRHDGQYYLFFSGGKCCGLDKNRPSAGEEYHILVCRSQNNGPMGPYVDKSGRSCAQGGGTMLLPSHDWVYAPGGQGLYDDPQQGPVLYYHYIDIRIGYGDGSKKFGWNKITFKDGWPTV